MRTDPVRTNAQVSGALERLKAIKEGGSKALEKFEVKQEAAVYDVVDEQEYAKIVAKRRAEGGGFVVDDDGMGYHDNGEDEDLVMPDGEGAEEGRAAGGKSKDASKVKGALSTQAKRCSLHAQLCMGQLAPVSKRLRFRTRVRRMPA